MYVMQKRLYLPVFTVKIFVLFGMFINNTRFSMACIVIREYMKWLVLSYADPSYR